MLRDVNEYNYNQDRNNINQDVGQTQDETFDINNDDIDNNNDDENDQVEGQLLNNTDPNFVVNVYDRIPDFDFGEGNSNDKGNRSLMLASGGGHNC